MSTVKVTFEYEPDEPDDSDSTGLSEAEFVRVNDALMSIGADNIEFERKAAE
jgi:hypothetical protein